MGSRIGVLIVRKLQLDVMKNDPDEWIKWVKKYNKKTKKANLLVTNVNINYRNKKDVNETKQSITHHAQLKPQTKSKQKSKSKSWSKTKFKRAARKQNIQTNDTFVDNNCNV